MADEADIADPFEALEDAPFAFPSIGTELGKAGTETFRQGSFEDGILGVSDIDTGLDFGDSSLWPAKSMALQRQSDFDGLGNGLGEDPPEPSARFEEVMEGIDTNESQSGPKGDPFPAMSASFPTAPLIKPFIDTQDRQGQRQEKQHEISEDIADDDVGYTSRSPALNRQKSLELSTYSDMLSDSDFGIPDDACSTLSSEASSAWNMDLDQPVSQPPPSHAARPSVRSKLASSHGSAVLPSVKRKQDRNAREQKRNWKISQQIGHLKEVLETEGRKVKNSKMAILVSVESFIRELEGQVGELSIDRPAKAEHEDTVPSAASPPRGSLPLVRSENPAAELTSGVDYRLLFNQLSTPMAVAGLDGRLWESNTRFEMATGHSKEELRMLTFFNLIAPEDLPGTFSSIARILNEPEAGTTRFTWRALQKQTRSPPHITLSLVRQGGLPKFFQCNLH